VCSLHYTLPTLRYIAGSLHLPLVVMLALVTPEESDNGSISFAPGTKNAPGKIDTQHRSNHETNDKEQAKPPYTDEWVIDEQENCQSINKGSSNNVKPTIPWAVFPDSSGKPGFFL
jgi:hypothetical protein